MIPGDILECTDQSYPLLVNIREALPSVKNCFSAFAGNLLQSTFALHVFRVKVVLLLMNVFFVEDLLYLRYETPYFSVYFVLWYPAPLAQAHRFWLFWTPLLCYKKPVGLMQQSQAIYFLVLSNKIVFFAAILNVVVTQNQRVRYTVPTSCKRWYACMHVYVCKSHSGFAKLVSNSWQPCRNRASNA